MERPTEPTTEDRAVGLYQVVYAHETFEEAAQALFELVQNAEDKRPGKSRRLFLDIEGHRNEHGGFDDDMRELQQGFLTTFLSRYLSEIHLPLSQLKNANPQDNVIPHELRMGRPQLITFEPKPAAERGFVQFLLSCINSPSNERPDWVAES